MIKTFNKMTPIISGSAYVAETATIIGDVMIGDNASVWHGAVLRGDEEKITVMDNTNIQENSVLHCDKNFPIFIGKNVTIGHNCTIHGCTIEDDCMIGMGAIILNGAIIKSGSVVGAGALVTGGKTVPANSIAMGNPFTITRNSTKKDLDYIANNASEYVMLAKKYKS